VDAAKKLRAELSSWHLTAAREVWGNTNVAVLELRLAELDAALEGVAPAPEDRRGDCSEGHYAKLGETCACGEVSFGRPGEAEATARECARLIVQDVAEIPDRFSPEDQPEMMLVTDAELFEICQSRVAAALHEAGGRAPAKPSRADDTGREA
jgi:hypothetical protein